MSEKYSPQAESNLEQTIGQIEHRSVFTKKNERIDHRNKHQERIKDIREKVGETAKKSDKINLNREDKAQKDNYKYVGAGPQLQAQALNQTLNKIQKKLPAYERQFSKFIHSPIVEKVSQAGGSTIARPNGLLFAGIFSFMASLVVLTICRYYGYEYNYLIGLASLGLGFVAGLFLEAITKLVKR